MMKLIKFTFEVGTDSPRDAASVFAALERVMCDAQIVPVNAQASNAPGIEPGAVILSASVRELRLASRTVNALTQAGIHTIGQVLALNPNQIREVPGIGRAGRMSIDSAIDELQLRRPDWHPR